MIAFSFVGTEADDFACGTCFGGFWLRWLRQQLWGLSIGSAVRRIGSRERWTAKIRLSEEAFPPCGDGSGRWLCPQPFNRLYFSGMGGMDCRLFAGEKFIFAGKCRQGSVRVAGVCRKRGESVFGGTARACRSFRRCGDVLPRGCRFRSDFRRRTADSWAKVPVACGFGFFG